MVSSYASERKWRLTLAKNDWSGGVKTTEALSTHQRGSRRTCIVSCAPAKTFDSHATPLSFSAAEKRGQAYEKRRQAFESVIVSVPISPRRPVDL
ncbi:hypothetical protein BaRGS_00014127 [Batillaria attramentaria]|uniref:Uncharacterized protein n=1 Tax=Batillaria attramentaria TaxID=370345 RepID=A0ABD0L567_9CAEN